MEEKIRYTGLKNLNEKEQSILKSNIEKEFEKIQNLVKNKCDLIVVVKTLKKDTKKRFIISFRLETPTIIFTVKTKDTEKGGDWDLTKATHKAINALYFEVKHRLRTDTQNWKKGGIKRLFSKL